LREERKYILFNHDRLYGIADTTYLLIVDKNHTLGLYRYGEADRKNYAEKLPEKRKEMENFFHAHIQTAAYILMHDLQNKKRKNEK